MSEPVPASDAATLARASALVAQGVAQHAEALTLLRRDLHEHPELSWREHRTTSIVADRLSRTGWKVCEVPGGGLVADLGDTGHRIGLRADLDALPVDDLTTDPWRSVNPGVAHACGHDVHTVGLLGAALALDAVHRHGLLAGRVRLLFQPAEESIPGGAVHLLDHGALDGVDRMVALHCDPSIDVGHVGLREGPLTGATDFLKVTVSGRGGHTSRPHLTEELTFALGKLITELPAIFSRRFDPRAAVSLVWGKVQAGSAANVIPGTGELVGTIRMLDSALWVESEHLLRTLVDQVVAPYGVTAQVEHQRGVPPVVNDPVTIGLLRAATVPVCGPDGVRPTPQSLGGEDFGWYLRRVPGAMARLGTRTPGGPVHDLHQGDLRVDERSTLVAARLMAEVALRSPAVPVRS